MPMSPVREGRGQPQISGVRRSETVLDRDDHIYAENLNDLMEVFRAMQMILDELGFQELHEEYSEHWETMPFKNGVEARKWKDPYTAIVIDVRVSVKEPRSDRKTGEEVYQVKLRVKAKAIKTRYPHWQWFEESTYVKRSAIYKWLYKLVDNVIFETQFERYKEEAEETGLEFISRLREIEGSLPAIGRSKREWYNPHSPTG